MLHRHYGWQAFIENLRYKRFHPRVFRKAFIPVNLLVSKNEPAHDGGTFDSLCSDCGIKDCHWYSHSDPENYPDDLISYKINAYGFRSDEFDKSLTSENYLYSGCSVTFGTGLPYDQSWAYMLNQHLGKEKFFNVAVAGSGYELILAQTYNYIEKYGNPKAVFLLLPNLHRDMYFTNHHGGLTMQYAHPGEGGLYPKVEAFSYSYETLFAKFYRQMLHFEYYCQARKIPLVWTVWHPELDEITDYVEFSSYVKHYHADKKESLIKKPKRKGKYWSMGRDQHRGGDYALDLAQTFEIAWRKMNEKTT